MAGLAVAWAFAQSGAAAAAPANVNLKITDYTYELDAVAGDEFEALEGRTSSQNEFCQAVGPIEIYRERSGRDARVDIEILYEFAGNGAWGGSPEDETSKNRELQAGSYYASVDRQRYEGVACDAARSKSFEIARSRTTLDPLEYVYDPDGVGEYFNVTHRSEQNLCADMRKATLFRVRKGADVVVDKGIADNTSEPYGSYFYRVKDDRPDRQDVVPGRYYVELAANPNCKGVRGKPIDVPIGETTIDIGYFSDLPPGEEPDNEFFEGYVGSETPSCHENRKVSVFLRKEGRDEKVVTPTTVPLNEELSRWFYTYPESGDGQEAEPGTYYAKALPKNGCEPATSEDVVVSSGGSTLAQSPGPARAAPAETDNTMDYYYWEGSGRGASPDREFFEGFLTSASPACENARKVAIYRTRRGEDERIARVETIEGGDGTARYFYVYPEETNLAPEAKPGTYYSVPAKLMGCEKPKSNRVPVGPGQPAAATTSLDYRYNPDPQNGDSEGLVGGLMTADESCGEGRMVTVYRKKSGDDRRVGKSSATDPGVPNTYIFSIDFDDRRPGKPDAPVGSYYAVPEKVTGCQAPKSDPVRVSRRSR